MDSERFVMEGVQHKNVCLDCESVFEGRYCGHCGQKAQHRRLPIKALFHDVLHDLFHFEHKITDTLWMLIRKPGFLTKEYLEGRRTRWVTPFRLFLVMSFICFLIPNEVTSAYDGFLQGVFSSQNETSTIQHQNIPNDHQQDKTISTKNTEKIHELTHSYMPKVPLFTMPFFAWLLYLYDRRKKKLFFDNLILSIHHHAFSYIIFIAITVANLLPNGFEIYFSLPLILTPIVHLGIARRQITMEGWFTTMARSASVSLFYLIFIFIFSIIIAQIYLLITT